MKFRSIAVFCGSQSGTNPLFHQHAVEVGTYLGQQNITLIYGGGNKGLMGAVANAAMAVGGKVTGIIPEVLIGWEHQHTGITDLQVVADMHARKKIMYDLCDAAIILPGGYGTLDELFEMLTWNTLKIHSKKIYLMNSAGFYDPLLQHIANMQEQQFLYENWQERILVCNSTEQIFSSFYEDKY